VVFDGKKYSLHLLPSGILNPKIINIMANGMVINPRSLVSELSNLSDYQLMVSDRAHIILPYHIAFDKTKELSSGNLKIGTTHKGIGPSYTDKYARTGMRMGTFVSNQMPMLLEEILISKNQELIALGVEPIEVDKVIRQCVEDANIIRPYVTDTSLELNHLIEEGKKILFEGAQGVMLCVDHGTYPYVTSSSPTAASVPVNTGIAPWLIEGAIGITKAYTTRVGEGPFPSEIFGDVANHIREVGHEYGTTTGRPRRVGWLDTVVLRHSKRVSGLSYLSITLLDVLTGIEEIQVVTHYDLHGEIIDRIPSKIEDYEECKPVTIAVKGWKEDITQVTSFEELPKEAKDYLMLIEQLVGVEVAMFSVGPDRLQTIVMKDIIGDDL